VIVMGHRRHAAAKKAVEEAYARWEAASPS
jgi:hypothetical protein